MVVAQALSARGPRGGPPSAPLAIRHLILDGRDHHPTAANGVYEVARRLTREQIHAGDEARIVVLRDPIRRAATDAVDVPTIGVALDGTRLRGRVVRLSDDAFSALLDACPDGAFVHIHGGRDPLLPWLSRQLRRQGIPYAVTVHGRYSHMFVPEGGLRRRAGRIYLALFERRLLEGARFVQALSSVERAILRRIARNATIEVVPNAAFSSSLERVERPTVRAGRGSDFPVFGYCGRYAIPHKGLDLLLDAFARHCAQGRPGRLVMIGTGPDRATLAGLAEQLGLSDRVEVLGPHFGEAKAALQRGWDFFVQPSRFDGMPIGALEAALAGLPLIATDATGLTDALDTHGAGFAVRTASVEAVAAAMGRAADLDGPAWSAMSERAHAMARAVGDWTTTTASLRALYGRRP